MKFKYTKSLQILLMLILVPPTETWSQVDKEFWFVAPEVSIDHRASGTIGGQPIYLNITTLDQAANITVSMPANTANFAPINLYLPANSTNRLDLTSRIAQVENMYREDYDPSIPGKNNKGILIQADQDITVYYESANPNNCDLFALKGKNALGSDFHLPFQTRFFNMSRSNWAAPAHSAFDVVFTEDDTYITIEVPSGQAVYNGAAGHEGTVRLGPFNKGETYAGVPAWRLNQNTRLSRYGNDRFGRSSADHLAGLRIRATNRTGTQLKRIAITLKDDSKKARIGGCYDLGGDQIVPLDIIGQEYIAMKGQLNEGWVNNDYSKPPAGWWERQETVYILATENNTNIYIDGGFVTTIDMGETYVRELINTYTHIRADKAIYVWQVTGLGCEMGGQILPAVDRCTGSKKVSFTRSVGGNNGRFYLNVLVRTGAEGGFTLNGMPSSLLEAGDFSNVTGTVHWKAARIGPLNASTIPVLQQSTIENSIDVFHVGIFNGGASTGTRCGYFSGFGDIPQINSAPQIAGPPVCAGNIILDVIGGGRYTTYQWYRNNQAMPGETNDTLIVSDPGRYKVTAVTTCGGVNTETFPSNEIDVLPCLNVIDTVATEGDPNVLVTIQLSHIMPGEDIDFEYETVDGTAQQGQDYTSTRGNASIPAGQQQIQIAVPLIQDLINEPDETVLFKINNSPKANILDSTAVITIRDDADPEPIMSFSDTIQVDENVPGAKLIIPFTLAQESGYLVSFNYTITDGTASHGSDYNVVQSGTISFPVGTKTQNLEIDILNDLIFEPGALPYEDFDINITNLQHASSVSSNIEVQIIDNEVIPNLNIANATGNEGTDLLFILVLDVMCSQNVQLDHEIFDIDATQGADYTFNATLSTHSIPANTLRDTIRIPLIDDGLSEGVEYFTFRFSNPVNAVLPIDPLNRTGTILDNTGMPMIYMLDVSVDEGGIMQFTVNISISNASPTNFEYFTSDATATAGNDYTAQATPASASIPANQSSILLSVPTIQDTEEEGNESFNINLRNASSNAQLIDSTAVGTIIDDDETPIAINDNFSIDEDASAPLTANVLLNDLGLGDAPITVFMQTNVRNGNLTLNPDGTFSYTPDPNFHGSDAFKYIVRDADGDRDEATVTITVNSVNDQPIAIDDNFGPIRERTHPSYSDLTGNVLTNDTGLGDSAYAVIVSAPSKGTVSLQGDGSFTYIPDPQEYGNDVFTYRLRDKDNEESGLGQVNITIDFYNDAAPVTNGETVSTNRGVPVTINILQNDTDIDGKSTIDIGSIVITDQPSKGTVSLDITTGLITYTPDPGQTNWDYIRYTVRDQKIGSEPVYTSNESAVSILITVNNQPPVAVCQDVNVYLDNTGKARMNASFIDGGSYDPNPSDAISFSIEGGIWKMFSCADIGIQNIELAVQDNNFSISTCNANITVLDTISPRVQSCPSDITQYTAPASLGEAINYSAPLFQDNCEGDNLTGTLVSGFTSGSSFGIGTTRIQYEYRDASNNGPAICAFDVNIIQDVDPPVVNCPANVQHKVNRTNNTYEIIGTSFDASATDNSGIQSLRHDYNGGGTTLDNVSLPIGNHTITWTAIDIYGNRATCSQQIEIQPAFIINFTSDRVNDIACEGDNITFSAQAIGGGVSYTYSYFIDLVDMTGPINQSSYTVPNPVNGQVIFVRVSNAAGFTYDSQAINVRVVKPPQTGPMYHLKN